jgi:ABC-type transport system involved in multi-copper enzyme maturation permease subunit
MSDTMLQLRAITFKEIGDIVRARLLAVISLFLIGAGMIALTVGAISLSADVAAYNESRDLLLSLGKPVDALVAPAFVPLKIMRGFIEFVEIIGAILGIVIGHRAATAERDRNTLGLLLSRPMPGSVLIAGKCIGAIAALGSILAIVFIAGALGVTLIGNARLELADYGRIALTFAAAVIYVGLFFSMGFLFSLKMRRASHAILTAFTVWLALVLIAPQIGDTMDPDNQVGSGVFRTLGIAKQQEKEIMKSFATYETVRDGIEQLSPAKHFERWSFALLGIKEIYAGKPLFFVVQDRYRDLLWLIGPFAILGMNMSSSTVSNSIAVAAIVFALVNGTAVFAATGDSDKDGIPDAAEALLNTDPMIADTDGDGVNDKDDAKPLEFANPIPESGSNATLALVSAKVEDNFDPVTKKDVSDHLEFEIQNNGKSDLKGLHVYLKVSDPSGKIENMYRNLSGVVIKPGQRTSLHFDIEGTADWTAGTDDFRANANSILYTIPSAKTLELTIAANGEKPVSININKDEGGAEKAD